LTCTAGDVNNVVAAKRNKIKDYLFYWRRVMHKKKEEQIIETADAIFDRTFEVIADKYDEEKDVTLSALISEEFNETADLISFLIREAKRKNASEDCMASLKNIHYFSVANRMEPGKVRRDALQLIND
jgi:hypothetical protein